MKNEIYVSPLVGGPKPNIGNDKCIVGQNCSTGFGAIVIIGGGIIVAVAVYCPPAVVVAVAA